MRLALAPRDQRTLRIGATVIVTLVALARGVPALQQWAREARSAAVSTSADLARATARVRLRRALGDSLAARNRRFLALAPALLSGDTPASAGATLAGLVSGAAAAAGVRLGAVQIHAPRADAAQRDAFTRIIAETDATGDVHGLAQLLALLERGPILLAVRTFAVTQAEPAAPADRMEVLHATLIVEGLMLAPRATARRSTAAATVRR